MKAGTKTLLFGAHQFIIHPLFVLWGWIKLYGVPNWKQAMCIIAHDWGYWGCADIDGKEGEGHPEKAANLLNRMIDKPGEESACYYLCLFHSRAFSKRLGWPPSGLCWADKLGTALMPTWLWVLLATMSGEVKESLNRKDNAGHNGSASEFFKWYKTEVVPKMIESGFLEYDRLDEESEKLNKSLREHLENHKQKA